MNEMASQITSLTNVYSSIYSDADQRKHQNYMTLALMRGIQQWAVNSPHKGLVTWKMFPFDDIIMKNKMVSWLSYKDPFIIKMVWIILMHGQMML